MQRPSSIARPKSIGRPSLLTDDIRQDMSTETPWKVSDASLRPIPPFYPPLDKRCSTIVTDSSPSVVAARIAETLKKRSISVEYDEDTNTATCMTVDRVFFQIHLYRGNRAPVPSNPDVCDSFPDLSGAVIVEVVRSNGSTLSFHRHNRSILMSAKGLGSGQEERKRKCDTSILEYPRLLHSTTSFSPRPLKRIRSAVPAALERALGLLKKDRIDCLRLGMESLVALTDTTSSGVDGATVASMSVVEPDNEIHSLLMNHLIQDRMWPGEELEEPYNNTSYASSNHPEPTTPPGETKSREVRTTAAIPMPDNIGLLRSLAMRILTNALTVLSESQPSFLKSTLSSPSHTFVSRNFLQALAQDLLGASRLPTVTIGTRLASVHEAAMATRCLKIISENSSSARCMVVNPKSTNNATLEVLEKNFSQVHHDVLHQETKAAYGGFCAPEAC